MHYGVACLFLTPAQSENLAKVLLSARGHPHMDLRVYEYNSYEILHLDMERGLWIMDYGSLRKIRVIITGSRAP